MDWLDEQHKRDTQQGNKQNKNLNHILGCLRGSAPHRLTSMTALLILNIAQ